MFLNMEMKKTFDKMEWDSSCLLWRNWVSIPPRLIGSNYVFPLLLSPLSYMGVPLVGSLLREVLDREISSLISSLFFVLKFSQDCCLKKKLLLFMLLCFVIFFGSIETKLCMKV